MALPRPTEPFRLWPKPAPVCAERFGPQRRLICTREPGHKGHHVDSEVRPG